MNEHQCEPRCVICFSIVPVKEKVAMMESLVHPGDRPKLPPKRPTVVTGHPPSGRQPNSRVQYRSQTIHSDNNSTPAKPQPPVKPRRSAKERHRRSMSDPNLHKSFQAMKELWEKQASANSDSKNHVPGPTRTHSKIRGVSESSSHHDKESATKQNHRPNTSPKRGMVKEKRQGPPTPTKPKAMQPMRVKEEHPGDIRKKAYSTSDQTAAPVGSSVKNRAKMFDVGVENKNSSETSKTSLNRNKNRSTTIDESYVSGRKTANEIAGSKQGSPRSVNNNDKITNEEAKPELARLLDHEETQERDCGEDLMSRMRRNSANLAKERRRNMRRGSNQSDTDSNCSGGSSLSSTSVEGPVVLRRTGSREEAAEKTPEKNPGNQSPGPVIKSYLHRNTTPKSIQITQNQTPKPALRTGSVGSPEERRGSVGSNTSSQAAPVAARRKSSLHKEHSSVEPKLDSPTAALNRKLSIDAVKRVSMSTDSGTGTVSPGIHRNSRSSGKSLDGFRDSITSAPGNLNKRGGSFSSISSLSKTPPAPPPSKDKPTQRARSASSSPMPIPPAVRPSVPPPPPPTAHKRSKSGNATSDQDSEDRRDSIVSTTTISSRMSLLSGLGDGSFSAEEEYNRILDVIATPTTTKRYRGSDSPVSMEPEDDVTQSISNSGSIDSPVRPVLGNRDSLEVPSRKSRASDNDSVSDYDPSDADDEGNQMALTASTENQTEADAAPAKVPVEVKLHNIAKELLSTEVTYVDVLHLIDQIFHKRVMEAISKKQISSDIKNIFSNVSAIYQFHSGFLLPQLQARLETWDTNPKLGDIMTQAAPFLKMYSLYVQNFDEALSMIRHWSEKSSNFANIIKQTQAMEECGNLTLEHHMLGPVQRIPRYKMLLEDYLKRLPEDSIDRPEAQTALELISQAATHSNETMRQSDKFNRLLSIYNNLVDINFDIVDVSRELIREGKIIKISARNGEKHERYLYLFNDMLLCCTPQRRLQRKTYKVTAKIDLDGMEVNDVANMTIPNTFCVNGTKKSMEFAANSPEDKEKWINAITEAIESFLERKTSFMKSGSQRKPNQSIADDVPPGSPLHTSDSMSQLASVSPMKSPAHGPISFEEVHTGTEEKRVEIMCTPGNHYVVDIEDHDLGKRAPRWIKDNEVTMCMNCSKAFNRLLRRRHHCRACGRVICTECSEHKLELQYDIGKTHKVCNKCYAILTGRKNTDGVDKKGVLEIEADIVSGDSVISEYLYFTESEKKKAWTKMWCVIPKNEPCLYVYGANQDVRAAMTMPLPGFTVLDDSTIEREYSFKLSQAGKVLLFAASSQEQKERWKFVFEKAGMGEAISRDDVYNRGQIKEKLQEEVSTRLSMVNGSRLSSSSADSSNVSASTSDSSRPSSLMDKTNSYSDVTENSTAENNNQIFLEETVTS